MAEWARRDAVYTWNRAYIDAIERQITPLVCRFPFLALRSLDMLRQGLTLKTTKKETMTAVRRVLIEKGFCHVVKKKPREQPKKGVWL